MIAVDHPGLYDLAALGHPAPIVLSSEHPRSELLPYRLTAAAHRRYRYVRVFLRFEATIAGSTARGAGYVNMTTGSGSSASAEFLSERHDGRLRIKWDTVDVQGETDHVTSRRRIRVDYPNYMLFDDVKPGRHGIRFVLRTYDAFRFDRVTISPRSGIQLTNRSPYRPPVAISARSLSSAARVGRPMVLDVTLRNETDRAVRDVAVNLVADRGLRVVGANAHRRWGTVRAHAVVRRRVRIVPLTPGHHTLRLSTFAPHTATSTGDLSFTAARPGAAATGNGPPTELWLALGAALAATAAWASRRFRGIARRRRTESNP